MGERHHNNGKARPLSPARRKQVEYQEILETRRIKNQIKFNYKK